MDKKLVDAQQELLDFALSFPEAHQDNPWGHPAIKVRKKAFFFCGNVNEEHPRLTLSVKLGADADVALTMPFASPTGYGLGKHGWISAGFDPGGDVPTALLLDWIEHSYRLIAPKTLVKKLDAE